MTTNSSLFELIGQCFRDEMIECCRFNDDVALSRAIYREEYRAIIVDAASGIDANRAVFARRACYGDRRAPLIVVGAFDGRHGIEQAFNAGADDVVCSPIDRNELAVRTHLALRRFQSATSPHSEDSVGFGPYRLDRRAGAVLLDGNEIRLTVREFAIAWLLFSHAGEYVSRRTIAGAIWSSTEDIVGRTLEQHIYKLRKKLNLNGTAGVQLRTMYAHGYRIEMCDGRRAADALDDAAMLPVEHRMTRESDALGTIAKVFEATRDEAGAASAANEANVSPQRATRPLDVHPEDSEAACSAQPWAQYAALWHSGAPHPANLVAHFVAPGDRESASATSFAVPAALLVHARRG